MSDWSRRSWLRSLGAGALGFAGAPLLKAEEPKGCPIGKDGLALTDFRPKSMLHVKQSFVPKAKFPVIDVHTHLSWTAENKKGVPVGEKVAPQIAAKDALAIMDRKNVRTMV